MDKIFCKVCKVHLEVDIYDVLMKNKKRVVCGKCRTILLNENELMDYFIYMSGAGWWACD
jgi:predicted  nucleic acid-binding Zn-ribbon protein